MENDTIGAISTPPGEGGIAVIRVSGAESTNIADKLFHGKNKLIDAPTHTVQYGYIVDPETLDKVDEVLVTLMRGPRSFTAEDVVEVSCHGGIVSVKRILGLFLQYGVRLAEPGEFTKRAFLNGRIDLSQAEAVIDVIRSKSDRAHQIALKQIEGSLSKKVKRMRDDLLELMAHIEVNIDYPEHDVEEMTNSFIQTKCSKVAIELDELLRTAEHGKVLREGIVTAIIGRPNVGKSSLLNALTKENKAIVTEIPGTTRDVIEEFVNINGVTLKLLDTAGIRETTDIVEKIGVERSKSALADADLILFVLNINEPLHEDERELLAQLKERKIILLLNKIDLPEQLNLDEVRSFLPAPHIVRLSILNDFGLQELESAISDLFFDGQLASSDASYVSNVRHIQLLKQAKHAMEEAIEAARMYTPIDMIQIDLRNAWESLGEITGNSASDSLLDEIFSKFCLGK